jgi:O-acetyl-ADP-ribose deacetylase (regulator of RNase III)
LTPKELRQERQPQICAAGADEFLFYPFHPAELIQAVQELLSHATPHKAGRYLLRELLWELSQSKMAVPGLTDVTPEEIKVLDFSGYDNVRLRSGATVFDVHLSWRPDIAPVIQRIAYEATQFSPAMEVVQGDLLDQEVEVIVNAWNRNIIPWWLLLPQGVSGAIKKRAGTQPFRELAKHGPIPLGQAVLTSAGKLPFRGIIHVAGINMLWQASEASIRQSVRSAMTIVEQEGFTSVAFPLIGAGSGGFSEGRTLEIILEELKEIEIPARVVVVQYCRG